MLLKLWDKNALHFLQYLNKENSIIPSSNAPKKKKEAKSSLILLLGLLSKNLVNHIFKPFDFLNTKFKYFFVLGYFLQKKINLSDSSSV